MRCMTFRLLAKVFTLIAMVCVTCAILMAQTETARISGLVTDASGAVVVGAQILVQNAEQGTTSTVATNRAGIYVLPSVRPGQYRISVRKEGFKTVDVLGVVVNVQDRIEENFRLQPGSITESITVTGGTPPVNTEDGTVSTVVDHQFVKELPLNGRSFQSLFQLTPGVVIASTSYGSQGQFSVNGERPNSNYFQVDGVSANVGAAAGTFPGESIGGSLPALTAAGGTNGLVSVDAMQEFALQTSSYAAEFGRSPGAQVAITTRSGTNEYHGDLFNYLRNDVMDANDWFANHFGLKRAELRQNDFGGVVGGALLKNKTFFFVSYEGLRLRQPSTGISDVPTVSVRQAASGVVQSFLNAFPLPTGSDEGNGLAPGNYAFSNPSSVDAASVRLDHHLNSNVTIFARYNRSTSSSSQRGVGYSLATTEAIPFKLQTLTSGITWTLRPDLVNVVRFNWSWSSSASTFANDDLGGAVPAPIAGVVPPGQKPGETLFGFSIDSGNNAELFYGPNARNIQRQINLVDGISWQVGNHFIKVGADYRRLTPIENVAAYQQFVGFSDGIAAANAQPDGAAVTAFASPVYITYNNYSAFAQDTWRMTRRLTATYGTRWDYNPAPSGYGVGGVRPLEIVDNGSLSNLSVAPPGTPLYHATLNNFAPRLGIAYTPLQSQSYMGVLRAGAGMFYDMGNDPTGNVFNVSPFADTVFLSPATFPLSSSEAAPPPLSVDPPYSELSAFPHTLRQPYTYHWNLAYEQELRAGQSLTGGYIGSAGHSLLRKSVVQQPTPLLPSSITRLDLYENEGYSNYNAFQAQFRRRQASGLEVLASYTWAHSLDNTSNGVNPFPPAFQVDPSKDYGNSDFDIRHTGSFAIDYEPQFKPSVAWERAVLSNWGLNAVLIARSAQPLDVVLVQNSGFGRNQYRPDVVPGMPLYIRDPSVGGGVRINPNAFTPAPSGQQGDLRRNSLRAFGLTEANVSLRRAFRVTERVRLQARLEAFNVLNHPNFARQFPTWGFVSGNSVFNFPSFGMSQAMFGAAGSSGGLGSGFSSLYNVGGPRSLQVALKLEF